MNKKDYNTPIREQVYALPEIVDQQLESCFNGEKLQQLMSMAEIFDVRKLYVVGCGDSWVAGGAMQPGSAGSSKKGLDLLSYKTYNDTSQNVAAPAMYPPPFISPTLSITNEYNNRYRKVCQ